MERFVNDAIKAEIPVVCEEMTYQEAKDRGAIERPRSPGNDGLISRTCRQMPFDGLKIGLSMARPVTVTFTYYRGSGVLARSTV